MTFPLVLHINTYIPGFQSTDESFAVLQGFWWLKYSFTKCYSWINEFVTAYPFGIQHDPVFIHPLWHHMSKYLSIISNEILAFNLIVLFNLLVSLIAMYYLAYYLTKNAFASFLSATLYALCPYQFARVWQHLSLTFTEWMPFYILCIMKLYSSGRLKDIFFCVFTFFLVIAFDLHYSVFMVVTTAIFIGYAFLFSKDFRYKNKFKVYFYTAFSITIISIITTLPFLEKIFSTIKTAKPSAFSIIRPFEDLFSQSAKPLSYLLPAASHPIFGKFTENFIGSSLYGDSFTEHTLYLGWIPLILAFIAFRRWRRSRAGARTLGTVPCGDSPYYKEDFYIGFFVFLAIVAWLFSQPPWWKIGPVKFYMPSFFMYKILLMFRAYCRFGIVVMLAIAVLAGFGLKFVLERFKTQKARIAITCLFTGLVLFEFWNYPPFKVIDVSKAPAVYYWLKVQPGDFAIAEYPLDADSPNGMYKFYQTKHEKKIINGTIPGTYANKVAQTITKLSEPQTIGVLKWMGVKYVLVHREGYLQTDLIEDREELEKIPQNSGLKFIRNFSAQECPQEGIMCAQKTGPIDVYEVIAEPAQP